ncbi:MAG: formate--tetrahydrofolate ligase [Cyclobacteriaceae bacterium]|nr:formate--tetrahydrofolate ligase [Cyclobacteriaceae bacterium]MCB0498538.1 formate--tetrahydrofolate ligase [Cyclobacteriaceae bacterium]MCB9236895.1 formate--tetrahydrofolate ligase [Flammeovirgaceae bacterium]MCO5271502.1 formate--tetrahydrofolate ligase [Cyclobacteriaceae bacterium]MCW5901398.1 formate--tetrahydrofolate ligase [Cyclobacteriaceae bacterium]
MTFKTDLEIAQASKPKPIVEIAKTLGIKEADLELYGKYKAKLPLSLTDEKKIANARLVLVTAMTPTPAGEGKTTTSIGLCEGLNQLGKKATVVLREPSLGPVFGMKGGAAGGGFSQVVPMEDINLHFTGDFAAIEKANNLLAALIDNDIQKPDGGMGIDPRTVEWKRVMDMNDRALRNIVSGLGGKSGGMIRETGFNITAASEIMAILCLAKNLDDLKEKIGNIYIGDTFGKKAVFAKDINAQGAVALLLKDAIKPNLVQTLEGNPAIIHGGPFANIAQGANSIIATRMGMSLSDFVVTEAGFGSDLGAEKFIDIVCGYGGFSPHAVVLVATIRALKYHGGIERDQLTTPNLEGVKAGFANLEKHIENTKIFGLPAVVSLNKFITDSDEEIDWVMGKCKELGVQIALAEGWEKGGKGMKELANQVVHAAGSFEGKCWPVYHWNDSVQEKIEAVAIKVYGAKNVEFLPKARQNLNKIGRLGLNDKPVCIAKTQNSFSDDAKKRGRPKDFTITVREIEVAAGAGFVIPITGDMLRMPGLPNTPAAMEMDIDNDGKISGLS